MEKSRKVWNLWSKISQRKQLSNKTLVFRNNIEICILSQLNVINSHDKLFFFIFGKRGTSEKVFYHKKSLHIPVSKLYQYML